MQPCCWHWAFSICRARRRRPTSPVRAYAAGKLLLGNAHGHPGHGSGLGHAAKPITVIDGGQKDTFYLLAEPEEGAERVGEVTGASQGVHVLETLENGWSYVECYSSSFHDSKLKLWNQLVSGYIRTELLVEKEVQPEYGIVIDKLTQRLYLFHDGELMDTLLVSTGLPNDKQPYNETRSGEFMIVSPVGDFPSGNMTCGYGMRFNNGDLLHEVPYLTNKKDGRRDYNYCEKELGKRASHGWHPGAAPQNAQRREHAVDLEHPAQPHGHPAGAVGGLARAADSAAGGRSAALLQSQRRKELPFRRYLHRREGRVSAPDGVFLRPAVGGTLLQTGAVRLLHSGASPGGDRDDQQGI